LRWSQYNPQPGDTGDTNDVHSFDAVKSLIRFPLLDAHFIADYVQPRQVLSDSELCELYTYLLSSNGHHKQYARLEAFEFAPRVPFSEPYAPVRLLLLSTNQAQLDALLHQLSQLPQLQPIQVACFNALEALPTAEYLASFSLIVFWTDFNVAVFECRRLGDALATYITQQPEHGVVICDLSASQSFGTLDAYNPLLRQGLRTGQQDSLGCVLDAQHPIASRVESFSGVSFVYNQACSANHTDAIDGHVLIEWESGAPLVAESIGKTTRRIARVVALNFFLPGFSNRLWDESTDGWQLIVNTINYAARRIGK
jgi:hypothetical protein